MHAADAPRTLPQARRVFLAHGSPRVIAGWLGLHVAVRIWLGGWTWWDLPVAVGIMAFWPVMEWWAHQHLLHWRPRRVGPWTIDPAFARIHRAHHNEPWDMHLVFLPLAVVVALGPLTTLVWWGLLPSPQLAWTATVAFHLMGLLYEWTHFMTHTRVPPRWAYTRRIHKLHRLHHFRNEHYWHSFTVPYIDGWFGTDPEPRSVPRSPTATTLQAGLHPGENAA